MIDNPMIMRTLRNLSMIHEFPVSDIASAHNTLLSYSPRFNPWLTIHWIFLPFIVSFPLYDSFCALDHTDIDYTSKC